MGCYKLKDENTENISVSDYWVTYAKRILRRKSLKSIFILFWYHAPFSVVSIT